MLLRDLVSSQRKLREKVIVLITPIYNADGNEKISTEQALGLLSKQGLDLRSNTSLRCRCGAFF